MNPNGSENSGGKPPFGEGRCMSVPAMRKLNELRVNSQLCDATVYLDDGTMIPVHRAVLCSCSEYFQALFTTSLDDTNKTIVQLPGLSPEIMHNVLTYIYLRKLDVNEENVYDLLITADYLGILGVLEICCQHLEYKLSPANCLGVFIFSKTHFCKMLLEAAWTYIMYNFVAISQVSSELLNLPLDALREIINADELNVTKEETVWKAIFRWINFNPAERQGHMTVFINDIRVMGSIDAQLFLEHIRQHPYANICEKCKPMIADTLKGRPRVLPEMLFAIGGWSGASVTNAIETYNVKADRWVMVEAENTMRPRMFHGTAVVNFKIYVIGGIGMFLGGIECLNSCICFDAVNKTWDAEMAPMNTRRTFVCTAVLNKFIYAMGGSDEHRKQNTVEKYDYQTNQWSLIAPMNMVRCKASACTLNDKIYITGGIDDERMMRSAEVYDPKINQWTMINPMMSKRALHSCVAYHGQVYCIGGVDYSYGISYMRSGEKYNPQNNTWTQIPDMYYSRNCFAIEVIDDMIFAIGGSTRDVFTGDNDDSEDDVSSETGDVESFDYQSNEWVKVAELNIPRSNLSAGVIRGLPNVSDYIYQQSERLMVEKRQNLIALEAQSGNAIAVRHTVGHARQLRQINMLQQFNVPLQNPSIHNPSPMPM